MADQQKAEAVVKELDAALAGFKPSVHRLSALLDRVGGGHRGWYGYGRPEEETYPEGGDREGAPGPAPDPPPVVQVVPGPGPLAEADPPPHPSGGEDFSGAAGDTRHVRRMAYHPQVRARPLSQLHAQALARAGRTLELASRGQDRRTAPAAAPTADHIEAEPAEGSPP